MNSHSFYLYKNIDNFMWNVRLSFTVSSFLHLKLSIHYFLFCIVSDEKSAVSLNFVPLYVIGLFGLPSRFTLYLWISSIYTCVYGVQFGRRGVIMHGLPEPCDWWFDVFHFIWEIIHQYLFRYLFYPHLFSI